MATAVRRHSIVNPARRHHAKRQKNKARRHMSAKQIKYFGTARQRAALKASRKRKRTNAHRSRNAAPPRRHTPTLPSHASSRAVAATTKRNRSRHRARSNRKRAAVRRSNPGEILTLTLGNPARRRSMAAHHKKARRHASASSRRRQHNPRRHRTNAGRRRHHNVHHRRPNPAMNISSLFNEGLSALVGMAGSRLLTQAVLGANNVGAYGYAGNAAATAVLAGLAHMLFKRNPGIRDGVIIGGTVGILARAMSDYTPFGGYLQQAGFGDYSGGGASGLGLYITTNSPTPLRFIGASGQTEVPPGWGAPPVVVQSSGAAGMGSYGRSRYERY